MDSVCSMYIDGATYVSVKLVCQLVVKNRNNFLTLKFQCLIINVFMYSSIHSSNLVILSVSKIMYLLGSLGNNTDKETVLYTN